MGRGDYLQLEPDPATKRGHGAPKPARVSAESAYRTGRSQLHFRFNRVKEDIIHNMSPEQRQQAIEKIEV